MYWENQPELPSDKGSNRSRGTTRDIGSGPLSVYIGMVQIMPYTHMHQCIYMLIILCGM